MYIATYVTKTTKFEVYYVKLHVCFVEWLDAFLWEWFISCLISNQNVKIAIQINGKTREIIEIKKDPEEREVVKKSKEIEKINKYLLNKKITRIIYVKNKIINYLIK